MAWYEDYLLANSSVFVDAGIKSIKIQDETREPYGASLQTVARMSALGRTFRRAFPEVALGIILQAHDAVAPLAIADACDADFVRLKIFVGASMNAEGVRHALSVDATDYRSAIARPDIRIMADVHDRTSFPLSPVPDTTAAQWARRAGADVLVLTGDSFEDSLTRVRQARQSGLDCPLYIGGGVTEANVAEALESADGVVVSTALLRKNVAADDLVRWSKEAARRLMESAGG